MIQLALCLKRPWLLSPPLQTQLSQCAVEVMVSWNHRTTSSAKSTDSILRSPHRTLHTPASPRDSVCKNHEQNQWHGRGFNPVPLPRSMDTSMELLYNGLSFLTRADHAGKIRGTSSQQRSKFRKNFNFKAGQAEGLCSSMTSPASWAPTYPKWQMPLVDLQWCHIPLKQCLLNMTQQFKKGFSHILCELLGNSSRQSNLSS